MDKREANSGQSDIATEPAVKYRTGSVVTVKREEEGGGYADPNQLPWSFQRRTIDPSLVGDSSFLDDSE